MRSTPTPSPASQIYQPHLAEGMGNLSALYVSRHYQAPRHRFSTRRRGGSFLRARTAPDASTFPLLRAGIP